MPTKAYSVWRKETNRVPLQRQDENTPSRPWLMYKVGGTNHPLWGAVTSGGGGGVKECKLDWWIIMTYLVLACRCNGWLWFWWSDPFRLSSHNLAPDLRVSFKFLLFLLPLSSSSSSSVVIHHLQVQLPNHIRYKRVVMPLYFHFKVQSLLISILKVGGLCTLVFNFPLDTWASVRFVRVSIHCTHCCMGVLNTFKIF